MKKVTIYTDGACRGNPGPGGYGSVLLFVDKNGKTHRKEFSAGYKLTTNNRMELLALIVALEALKSPCEVEIFSDSKYVVDAFNQDWISGWLAKNWKKVKNVDMWKRLLKAIEPHKATFNWVKGHADNKENERCDKLATSAADGFDCEGNLAKLMEDSLYADQNNQLF